MAERVNDQVDVATPAEITDRGLFEFNHKDEAGKPIKEETLAPELDQKVQVSDPVEIEDAEAKKDGGVLNIIPRSYSSSSSDEEGDDEETKQRKKEKREKKGLKEKLVEKLPGHKDEVVKDTHVPTEEPHVQEVVYSEPPHQEEEPEKKRFLDKIKEKLPAGQNKTDDHHDEAVPVVAKPVVEGQEDKKGFMDKIKDKIPGLCSPKTTGDEKNDHENK